MDGRPNRRNKAAFSNFSGVMRMGPDFPSYCYHYFSNKQTYHTKTHMYLSIVAPSFRRSSAERSCPSEHA